MQPWGHTSSGLTRKVGPLGDFRGGKSSKRGPKDLEKNFQREEDAFPSSLRFPTQGKTLLTVFFEASVRFCGSRSA
jgi:hypothetical protein